MHYFETITEDVTGKVDLIGRVAEDPTITYLRMHKHDAKNAQPSCIIE